MKTARELASEAGKIFYSPEKPCNRGHLARRYVSSGQCSECLVHVKLLKNNRLAKNTVLEIISHPEDAAAIRSLTTALLRRDPRAVNLLALWSLQ